MTDATEPPELEQALHGLAARIASLHEARSAYPADLGATLDAALAELETARDLLRLAVSGTAGPPRRAGREGGAAQREQKLLRQVFRTLPVPVAVLDAAAVIRRVNAETSRLLGSPVGYLTGRAFPSLVDAPLRAAFRSHLSAVLRTGETAAFRTRLAHQGRSHQVRLVLTRLRLPGEPQAMVAAVALPVEVAVPEPPPPDRPAEDPLIMAAARRRELMSRITRVLLDEESLREPVALIRTGRLLAAELADWVVADVLRDGAPRRAVVIGPDDRPVARLQRMVEGLDPAAAPVVEHVLSGNGGVVHEMVEDESLLGRLPTGAPVLAALEAGSVLSVPIRAGAEIGGALTLVRHRHRRPFALADLGFAEDLGEHLGPALRARRSFQRRAQAAETLQTGVLPRSLPEVPGFETAAVYHAGTAPRAIGGEFYDLFPTRDGWGFVLAGASGRGEEGATASALVRGGLRVLSATEGDPVAVVARLNDALVRQETGTFVMAVVGFVSGDRAARRVRLVSAGHHPVAVLRPDGSVRFTEGGGLPLGFEPGAEAVAEELTPAEGETLVLCSDGLVGARGQGGEAYGEARLREVLARCAGQPPAAVVKAVEEDHRAFCGGYVPDEMTVLSLRRSR